MSPGSQGIILENYIPANDPYADNINATQSQIPSLQRHTRKLLTLLRFYPTATTPKKPVLLIVDASRPIRKILTLAVGWFFRTAQK